VRRCEGAVLEQREARTDVRIAQPERHVAICDLHHDAEHLQQTSYT
jgi:hypothetical protein